MEEKELKYSNQKEYLNFITKFPRIKIPIAGTFCVFTYLFHKNPEFKNIPIDKKKFYSFQPCDMVLFNNPKKKYFVCINFNQMSVRARQLLLTKIKSQYPSRFDEGRILIPGMNYRKLLRFLKKAKIAIRRYRYDRVLMMRYIPAEKLDDVILFTANFYYKTNYNWVANKYLKYVPDF